MVCGTTAWHLVPLTRSGTRSLQHLRGECVLGDMCSPDLPSFSSFILKFIAKERNEWSELCIQKALVDSGLGMLPHVSFLICRLRTVWYLSFSVLPQGLQSWHPVRFQQVLALLVCMYLVTGLLVDAAGIFKLK